ncbi:sugar phosphate isomerase/epimerase family protein [Thermodesulfobacteriota bacterium]
MNINENQALNKPKLVMCNLFPDMDKLIRFAVENGFDGIDWSFALDILPETPAEETAWVKRLEAIDPLEVRYHCPFMKVDLGHDDPDQVKAAVSIFRRIIQLVSKADGKYLTIHIGLGHETTKVLSWDATIDNLRHLVQYGAARGVKVCLENLAWGWTSKPNLFEKLIRRTGAGVTLDIGHAHACESVRSQLYTAEDFVTPHPDRVFNAHIYHTEIPGVGHIPPVRSEDIKERLEILQNIGCKWWVIEIREVDGLLRTKKIIDAYLEKQYLNSDTCIDTP